MSAYPWTSARVRIVAPTSKLEGWPHWLLTLHLLTPQLSTVGWIAKIDIYVLVNQSNCTVRQNSCNFDLKSSFEILKYLEFSKVVVVCVISYCLCLEHPQRHIHRQTHRHRNLLTELIQGPMKWNYIGHAI